MYGNPYQPKPTGSSSASPPLPQWKRNELLEQLGGATQTAATSLLDVLGMPGRGLMGLMAHGDPLEGATGEELLKSYSLLPDKRSLGGWGKPLASFATEVVLDPLNLVTMGTGSASRAAKAAKAAGIYDDAARVASRRLIDDIGRGATTLDDAGHHAQKAAKSFETNFGKSLNQLNDAELSARPLIGRRRAARTTTLDDLIQAQPDVNAAKQSVNDYLKRFGKTADDFSGQTLGTDIGLALGDMEIAGKIPLLGNYTSDAFDLMGQSARWGRVGRAAHAAFDKKVLGTVDEGDQILATGLSKADELADQVANRKIAEMMQSLPEAAFDPKTSRAFRSVIEGVANAEQQNIVKNAGLEQFAESTKKELSDYIKESRKAGIGSAELDDPYGLGYFPRSLRDDIFEGRVAPSAGGGKTYNVMAGDQLQRSSAYQMPGGTAQAEEISQMPELLSKATDEEAAQFVYEQVKKTVRAGQPEYTMKQARKFASDARKTKSGALEKAGFFSDHFTEDYGRYIRSRERSLGRSNVIYDAIAGQVKKGSPLNQQGTGFSSVDNVINQIGLKTSKDAQGVSEGAIDQLLDRLKGQGFDSDSLRGASLDSRTVQRLNRINDFYQRPELQSSVLKFLDDITRLWKSSVLSWPARFTRDWYSGHFTNILEVGNPADLYRGTRATKRLLQGQFEELGGMLADMPRYTDMSADEAIKKYQQDLAAAGLLQGRRLEDLGMEVAGRQGGRNFRDSVLPGMNPATTFGYQATDLISGRTPVSFKQTASAELASVQGYREGFGGIRDVITGKRGFSDYLADNELRDPILRWASRLGDTTDSMNRLNGFNALLYQGIDPIEAGKRIKAAQVDYSSLTNVEREWFRRLVPFWSFNSRMGKYIAGKVWQNPGGTFTQLGLRLPQRLAENNEEGYIPKEIKESYGASLESMRQIPGLGTAINAIAPKGEGKNSYVKDIDLPGVDLINMLKIQRSADGSVSLLGTGYESSLNAVSSLAHPYIRTGVEMLSGRNLYTDQSLAQFEPTLQKVARKLGVPPNSGADRAVKGISTLVEQIPHAPRVLQLLNRAVDAERTPEFSARALQALVDSTSGVKIRNIMDDAASLDARREIDAMLDDSPLLRTFEQKYIPEELRPYASPEELLLYDLSRQLNKEAREARKARQPARGYANPYQ